MTTCVYAVHSSKRVTQQTDQTGTSPLLWLISWLPALLLFPSSFLFILTYKARAMRKRLYCAIAVPPTLPLLPVYLYLQHTRHKRVYCALEHYSRD